MKLITCNSLLPILIAFLLVFIASPLTAQIYKTVDKDGNVTFTDQPPGDGSQPVELPPLSIIEAPTYETPAKSTPEGAEGEEPKEMSLKSLRDDYRGFAIVSPRQEESIWFSENFINIAWSAPNQLQPGMRVTVAVDGVKQPPTNSQTVVVTGLERGEHTVFAELRDARNRRIAVAETITFFIRQPGLYNRARPALGGGG